MEVKVINTKIKKLHTDDIDFLQAYADSRIGGRAENQDSCGAQNTKNGFVVTVCDGMGGGPGGKTASTIAVTEILKYVNEATEGSPNEILENAVKRANTSIINHASQYTELRGMGSTATVLLVSEKSAFIAHVGDSRVYQIHGTRKIFRTFDHSMVFDLVRQKVITEEQARLSAQSNVITRALGIKPDVEVDVEEVPYSKGDRFVLCSDGIHGTMPEKDLLEFFGNHKKSLSAVVDEVASYVDTLGRSSGGHHDNLTIAMVEMNKNSKLKKKISKTMKIFMTIITILCIVSIAANIYLLSGNKTDEAKIYKDSITTLKNNDSIKIKALNDSIASIKVKLDKINKLSN